MSEEHEQTLKLAKDSLSRIQGFDAGSIVRTDKLGVAFDFSPASESAAEIIKIFNQVDVDGLSALPVATLHGLHSIGDSTMQIFQQCLDYDPTAPNASSTRDSIVASINSLVSAVFNTLSPIISYLSSQQAGAKAEVERILRELGESRAAIRALVKDAEVASEQTTSVLSAARSTSGKVGVQNEASHFKAEADAHRSASENWKTATIWAAVVLLLYSISTAFLHKWTWFMPTTNIGMTQFIVSKILIFGVLGYLRTLSAKNFLNHKHNEIVNKHGQNALLTYETMVNAGQTDEARNIVLQLAAASVYQLHDTGYVKSSEGSGRGGIIEILPKTSIPLNSGGSS